MRVHPPLQADPSTAIQQLRRVDFYEQPLLFLLHSRAFLTCLIGMASCHLWRHHTLHIKIDVQIMTALLRHTSDKTTPSCHVAQKKNFCSWINFLQQATQHSVSLASNESFFSAVTRLHIYIYIYIVYYILYYIFCFLTLTACHSIHVFLNWKKKCQRKVFTLPRQLTNDASLTVPH